MEILYGAGHNIISPNILYSREWHHAFGDQTVTNVIRQGSLRKEEVLGVHVDMSVLIKYNG